MTTETATPAKSEPTNRTVHTLHSIKIGDTTLNYRLTVGTVVLREEADKDGLREGNNARAELFFMAYSVLDDAASVDTKRPITFSFNGGPGSSSVWMHLGLLGPKRVVTDDFGNTPAPPGALADNPLTLLTHSDLVFIDPIGTGFSRRSSAAMRGFCRSRRPRSLPR